jgi:hypothetical protein
MLACAVCRLFAVTAISRGLLLPSIAGDYYVGGAGASDANPGSRSQPFATLQKAAEVAAAGDLIKIRGGICRETVVPTRSGAPGHPITFEPDGDAIVTVSGADPADGGWTIHRIFNNTLASTDTNFWHSFNSYPASSPTNSQNNVYRSAIKPNTPGTTELTAETDPRFVNAGQGGLRFRLRPNSPAIDSGAVIPGVTDGYVGRAPDLGAYKYGGAEWVAGCSFK